MQLGFDLSAPFKSKLVEQPSIFLTGEDDGLNAVGGSSSPSEMRKVTPGLIALVMLPNVAHWPQLEAADATSAALLQFLKQAS